MCFPLPPIKDKYINEYSETSPAIILQNINTPYQYGDKLLFGDAHKKRNYYGCYSKEKIVSNPVPFQQLVLPHASHKE